MLETKLTIAQLRGEDHIPIHPREGREELVLGEPLIWAELLQMQPTRMCELNQWYMKQSAEGIIMFAARVQDSYLYRGIADV